MIWRLEWGGLGGDVWGDCYYIIYIILNVSVLGKEVSFSGEEASSFPVEVSSWINGIKWSSFSVLFSFTPFHFRL